MSFTALVLNYIFKHSAVLNDIYKEREINANRKQRSPKKGTTISISQLNGLSYELIERNENKQNPYILYIHGGGFTIGSAKERRSITLYLAEHLGYNVIAPDYRLNPEYKLPTAFTDCFNFYDEIVKQYPHLIIMGESAGATIALSLTQRVCSQNNIKPLGCVLYSIDSARGKDFPSRNKNIKTDYMLKDKLNDKKYIDLIMPEGYKKEDLDNPIISPLYGDFTNLCPLLINVSDTEVLYDD